MNRNSQHIDHSVQHRDSFDLSYEWHYVCLQSEEGSGVVLLYLSAAFDTMDHSILLNRLHKRYGITGTALSWFETYLTYRCQVIQLNGEISDEIQLHWSTYHSLLLLSVRLHVDTVLNYTLVCWRHTSLHVIKPIIRRKQIKNISKHALLKYTTVRGWKKINWCLVIIKQM